MRKKGYDVHFICFDKDFVINVVDVCCIATDINKFDSPLFENIWESKIFSTFYFTFYSKPSKKL